MTRRRRRRSRIEINRAARVWARGWRGVAAVTFRKWLAGLPLEEAS